MKEETEKERKKNKRKIFVTALHKNKEEFEAATGFHVKEPSEEFVKALESLWLDFTKLKTKVAKIFKIGRAEGWPDDQIGWYIRYYMKEHYSKVTIWRVFENYPEAIYKKFTNKGGQGYKKKPSEQETQITETETEQYEQTDESGGGLLIGENPHQRDPEIYYNEIIANKNRLIEQQQEEIAELKKENAELKKKLVAALELKKK